MLNAEDRRYVNNLLAVYDAATPEQIAEGVGWYRAMRAICQSIADETNHSLYEVCGGMAALSPLCNVARNISITLQAAEDPSFQSHPFADRAREILHNDGPWSLLGELKTRCFAENIMFGGQSRRVTFDRWAYRAMTGNYGPARNGRHKNYDEADFKRWSGKYNYGRAEEIYREAARIARRYPANFQAICWVVVRNGGW